MVSASFLAQDDLTLFLGDDLIPWLMLAVGAALAVANVAAYVRPPLVDPKDPDSPRRPPAPLARVVPFAVVGVVLALWALATLLS
ncbi:MAG: hypothetical protein M9952_02270 [Microthrixaceae bacterium]|nr:hypothetical protein [Microthrixaceae bacterium]